MNILTIPLRNARRKWARTLLLLLVFAMGVASIVSLDAVSRVVGESLERKLTAFGANILVYPKAETLTVSYGGFSMGDMLYDVQSLSAAEVDAKVRSIKNSANIASVAPKLVTMIYMDDKAVGLVGVDWEQELRIKSYWAVDGAFPKQPGEVLLGSEVARHLGIGPGAELESMGLPVVVAGVLHPTGGEDDGVVLADLAFVQEFTGQPGRISFAEVAALCAGCPIEEIVNQIGAALPGVEIKALQSIVKQRMYSVNFVKQLILAVSVVILLTACAMIGLSMLSAVSERKKEIGVLRSMGYSRGNIFAIFCLEALAIGILAGLLGYAGGYLLSFRVLEALDIVEDFTLGFEPVRMAVTCGFMAAVSALSASIPAYKASRIEPSEALITL